MYTIEQTLRRDEEASSIHPAAARRYHQGPQINFELGAALQQSTQPASARAASDANPPRGMRRARPAGFLELEDVIDFTRTTKDASALVTRHDNGAEPALERLHAWRRRASARPENEGPPLHERRVDDDGQRGGTATAASRHRPARSREMTASPSWRLRFREPASRAACRDEEHRRSCRPPPDGARRRQRRITSGWERQRTAARSHHANRPRGAPRSGARITTLARRCRTST